MQIYHATADVSHDHTQVDQYRVLSPGNQAAVERFKLSVTQRDPNGPGVVRVHTLAIQPSAHRLFLGRDNIMPTESTRGVSDLDAGVRAQTLDVLQSVSPNSSRLSENPSSTSSAL